MTWNDLECPFQLNVRMLHGLLELSYCSCIQQMRRSAKCTISEVSEPRMTCVADALSLCGSWAFCRGCEL